MHLEEGLGFERRRHLGVGGHKLLAIDPLLVRRDGLPVKVERTHEALALGSIVGLKAEGFGLDKASAQIFASTEGEPEDKVAHVVLETLREQVGGLDRRVGVERQQTLGQRIDGILGLSVGAIARLRRLDLGKHSETVNGPRLELLDGHLMDGRQSVEIEPVRIPS